MTVLINHIGRVRRLITYFTLVFTHKYYCVCDPSFILIFIHWKFWLLHLLTTRVVEKGTLV